MAHESVTAEALLDVITGRLDEISRIQHALAVERAELRSLTGPLRLGVMSPEAVLVHLEAKGVRLAAVSVTPRRAGRRRERAPRR